jgi:hypothetical protein
MTQTGLNPTFVLNDPAGARLVASTILVATSSAFIVTKLLVRPFYLGPKNPLVLRVVLAAGARLVAKAISVVMPAATARISSKHSINFTFL